MTTNAPAEPRLRRKLGTPNMDLGPPMFPTERSLGDLRPGQAGRVVKVQAEPQLALRILEMGLVCGALVRFLRAAPLGGPIEVDVEGFLLSLRRREAEAVTVEVDGAGL